jgi:hypothetical protein
MSRELLQQALDALEQYTTPDTDLSGRPTRSPIDKSLCIAIRAHLAAQPAPVPDENPKCPDCGHRALGVGCDMRVPHRAAQPAPVPTDELAAFEAWWDKHGQYVRSGGGQYEVSFAYAAWQARSVLAAQPAPVPSTEPHDVASKMRKAAMTFHLGMPHAAVMEQMTRFHDLVCMEATIKAATAFAAPVPVPLTDEQINAIWNGRDLPEHRSNLTPWGMDRIRAIIAASHGIAASPEKKP